MSGTQTRIPVWLWPVVWAESAVGWARAKVQHARWLASCVGMARMSGRRK